VVKKDETAAAPTATGNGKQEAGVPKAEKDKEGPCGLPEKCTIL
jgi:hypothetical protein